MRVQSSKRVKEFNVVLNLFDLDVCEFLSNDVASVRSSNVISGRSLYGPLHHGKLTHRSQLYLVGAGVTVVGPHGAPSAAAHSTIVGVHRQTAAVLHHGVVTAAHGGLL